MEPEVKTPEVDNKPKETIVATTTPPVEPEETTEQINWRKFRETRKIDRAQKEEAEKRAVAKEAEANALKQAMEALLSKNNQSSQSSNGEYQQEESEDIRIQKKVDAAIQERDKRDAEYRRQREIAEYPQRLEATYSDFSHVCSSENLDYIDYHYPEISKAFQNMPEGFDKWAAIYKSVKKLIPNTDSRKDQAKADKNFNKPQAMSAPGKTQTGDNPPLKLDDKRRTDNWERMKRVMNKVV